MASTYLSLHYHLVFGTKDRLPLIDSAWRLRLHEYLGGIIRDLAVSRKRLVESRITSTC